MTKFANWTVLALLAVGTQAHANSIVKCDLAVNTWNNEETFKFAENDFEDNGAARVTEEVASTKFPRFAVQVVLDRSLENLEQVILIDQTTGISSAWVRSNKKDRIGIVRLENRQPDPRDSNSFFHARLSCHRRIEY